VKKVRSGLDRQALGYGDGRSSAYHYGKHGQEDYMVERGVASSEAKCVNRRTMRSRRHDGIEMKLHERVQEMRCLCIRVKCTLA
jgi:hypothetical protein